MVNIADFVWAWMPIVLIAVLAVGFRLSALQLALWGTAGTIALVVFRFDTPLDIVALSALDGFVRNLPVLLVIYSGMLLAGLLLATGSFSRFLSWFSSLTKTPWHNVLLISVGTGNFMEGAGIVAEPITAPMLTAAGLPPAGAAALSIAGYSGLMMLELGGSLLAVLALVTGLDSGRLAPDVALLSFPAAVLVILGMPWLTFRAVRPAQQLPGAVLAGVMAGGGALFSVHWLGSSVAGIFAGLTVIAGLVLIGSRPKMPDSRLVRDMAPLLLLSASLFSVNLFEPLRLATQSAWAAEATIVPGHGIRLHPLFSAYTYIALCYVATVLMHREWQGAWTNFRATNRRAWRPMLAMALFGMTGQIIAFSGYESGFIHLAPERNIALILANGMVALSGDVYPIFVPFIGWIGTFLTGYGTASIVLFGKLHVSSAQMLGLSPSLMTSALAVGSAVGSISSPLKVALATSMCGAEGRDGLILRRAIPLGIVVCILLGILLFAVTRFPGAGA